MEEKAKNIIANNLFMTISTATPDGEPWVTPVFYAHDKNYTLYWYSAKNTKHSQLIERNSKVAIAIFNPHASEEEAGGVYIVAKAYEVTEDELPHVLNLYFSKATTKDLEEKKALMRNKQDFLGKSILRMYKAIPEKAYVSNDAEKWNGKWIDSRSEVIL